MIYKSTVGEVEINYKTKDKPKEKIMTSKNGADFFKSVWTDKIEYVEEVLILLMNRAHNTLGWVKISAGGTAGTVVDVKMIMQAAILSNASKIMLCHNHPSGNLTPSDMDIKITKQVKEAGKLLEITVLDHIIITSDSYFSFADEGMM